MEIARVAATAAVVLIAVGRWLQSRESDAGSLGTRVIALQARVDQKADYQDLAALEGRLDDEHDVRRRLTERFNVEMGRLQVDVGRLQEKASGQGKALERVERAVETLQRQRGGVAGV